MEPIGIRPHPSLVHRPEYNAKQIIFNCGNGYGLSVITASGYDHGFFCNSDDGTYEICLIKFESDNPSEHPFRGHTAHREKDVAYHNVIGYLTLEDVYRIAEAIERNGISEYKI